LSPEALTNIAEKSKFATFDQVKNDVYGLAITILECMSLKNGSDFYEY